MIEPERKAYILERLKAVNNGEIDFITVDDIVIEPFGLESETNYQSTTVGKMYGGGNYTIQKYRLKAKEGRDVVGEMVIELTTPGTIVYHRQGANDFSRLSILEEALPFESLEDTTDFQKIRIWSPGYEHMLRSDFGDVGISSNQYRGEDGRGYTDYTVRLCLKAQSVNESMWSKYTKVEKNTTKETQMYYTVHGKGTNISLHQYLGEVDVDAEYSYSLERGEVSIMACHPTKEYAIFSTNSMIIAPNTMPDFEEMFPYFYGNGTWGFRPPIKINDLPKEYQKTIIDYLAKVHHWKWGTQNKPNDYSETPNSHNLNNSIVRLGVGKNRITKYSSSSRPTISESRPKGIYIYDHENRYRDQNKGCLILYVEVDNYYNTKYIGNLILASDCTNFIIDTTKNN
jgi:hypothetical protein